MRKKVYSQLIAPFKRVTNAPLELDFKFDSVERLKVWATANSAILHAGLLKIVENRETKEYDFYSFKEIASTSGSAIPVKSFEIVKLFSINDIDNVKEDIEGILDQIHAIWGVDDPANIDERLNSIAKLAERIKYINERIKELKGLHQTDKAIIGYTGDDLIEYLTTLKYNSITVINNALDDFLNKNSDKGQPITTWKDLQDFLAGYTNDQTLKDIILEITGGKLTFIDSDTIGVEVLPLKDRIQVKHSVKLGAGVTDNNLNNRDNNFIIVKNGGLFYNLSIKDTGKALRFKCNGNIVHIFEYADIIDKKIEEQTDGLVDIKDIYYDQANEQIVIIFDSRSGDKIVRIPMSIIIREWEPLNIPGEPVKLELTPAEGEGKDKLKAILQVSTEPGNIVEKKRSGLYVSGDASRHIYGDTTVADALDKLKEKDVELTGKIEEGSVAVDEKLESLKDEINHKFEDKTIEFNQKIKDVNDTLSQRITDEVRTINDTIEAEVGRLEEADKVLAETVDRNRANIENALQDARKALDERITMEVGTLNDTIDENKRLTDEALVAHKQSNEEKFNEIDAAIEALGKVDVDDKTELTELITATEEKLQKSIEESYNTLNDTINSNKADIDKAIEDAKKEAADNLAAAKEEIMTAISDMKNELLDTIIAAIEAHVSEHHTWVDASEVSNNEEE